MDTAINCEYYIDNHIGLTIFYGDVAETETGSVTVTETVTA
jgi:hypothetical protein